MESRIDSQHFNINALSFQEQDEMVYRAIKRGDLNSLQHVCKYRLPWCSESSKHSKEHTCELAIIYGRLDVLKYLRQLGAPWNDSTVCNLAAFHGRLNILQYAHENNCRGSDGICKQVILVNNLPCLQYIHRQGYRLGPWDFRTAIECGYLEIIKYMMENGFVWDERIYIEAAARGYLHVLQYFHKCGYPWAKGTCSIAARNEQEECCVYAHSNGSPCDDPYECEDVALYEACRPPGSCQHTESLPCCRYRDSQS